MGADAMPHFQVAELLSQIAPDALCEECIIDRTPILVRPKVKDMLRALKAPQFERLTGECVACTQTKEVIRYG
jgi:hypothetical protein